MTALGTCLTSAIAIWGTVNGLGPLVRWPESQRIILLQTFLAVVAATGLMLSAALAERRRATATLRRQHRVLEAITEGTSDAVFVKDLEGRYLMINTAGARFLGQSVAEVLGKDDRELFSPDTAATIMERDRLIMAKGETQTYEDVATAAGVTRIFLSTKAPYIDHRGRTVGLIGISRDISDRKRAEQAAQFLADAGVALAALVDPHSTLQGVARLAVPTFADWCVVDMTESDGSLRRVAVAHADPAKVNLGFELHRRYPPDPRLPYGPTHVLATGKPELIPDISDEQLERFARDAEHLRLLRELALKSYIWVPLRVRGKNVGVIAFVTAQSSRRYDDVDLSTAQELARRASIALENSRLYGEVQAADRRKNEFLATLAHELRNPLAAIRNTLHILLMPAPDPATHEQARNIMDRQVQHLVRLVDDLLDVSRIMQGKIELKKERINLASAVSHGVEISQPAIDAAGHRLSVSLPAQPILLEADMVRLAQVIANLLNNAAKYTEPGGRIELRAERDGDLAVVRIRDSGIGIAPEMLPLVFDLFMQADRAIPRAQGGMGIGLTLARNLVEMHGGNIRAESAGRGKGSEFIVRIPALAVDTRVVPDEVPISAARLPARRILVVDDNADSAESLATLMRLHGQDVRVAYDGPRALEAAAAEPPELVFLDIGMPEMDGYEVARRLRRLPALRDAVLVALTGWGQDEDRQRSKEAGFDFHLTKPADLAVLQQVLASAPANAGGAVKQN
jgi:PAS domain S-box-containing protein